MIGGYTQVQTFLTPASKEELEQALRNYQLLLSKIGYINPEVEQWLSVFAWNAFEGGYGDTFTWQPVTIMGEEFRLAPHIYGATIDHVGSPWVAFELFFPTGDLEIPLDKSPDPDEPLYKRGVGRPLWEIICLVSSLFSESGVYLTDELDDRYPWYALLKGKRDGLWSFDLALIPTHLTGVFSSVPNSHQSADFEYGVGLARKKRWVSLPWEVRRRR
jgi:hypothetical protein